MESVTITQLCRLAEQALHLRLQPGGGGGLGGLGFADFYVDVRAQALEGAGGAASGLVAEDAAPQPAERHGDV